MKRIAYFLLKIVFRIFAPKRPIVTATIQNVLVIKLCCIGDILFTTPLTKSLKTYLPRMKLSYMVTSWCRPLVEANHDVDNIIEFDAYNKISIIKRFKTICKVIQEIRKQKIDLAIVLHRTPMAGLLTAFSGVPVRIGFDWEGRGFSYTHPVSFRGTTHEIDRNLDCLRPLGYAPQTKQAYLEPNQAAQLKAEQLLIKAKLHNLTQPLITIFPGGGVNPGTTMTTKRWTIDGYRQLCHLLIKHYDAKLVLVGSKEDGKIGDELIEHDELLATNILRLEGQTELMTLAALLQKCDLFIGGDSGPLHMADATGCATVSIFGPTDPKLLAPRGRQHRMVKQNLACSPCFTPWQLDNITCKIGSLLCMTTLSADHVFEAAQDLLDEKGFDYQ